MKKINKILIAVIFVFIAKITFAQTTTSNNVRPTTPAFTGWNGAGGNSGTLEVRNDFASDINFFTNTTQKATILSNGNMGIGTATPGQKLTVSVGNINLATSTKRYMISGDEVLWHNGNTTDIFVGYHAGNASMLGHNNTYMGYGAGYKTTQGYYNTIMGSLAGDKLDIGADNSIIGAGAGSAITSGFGNTIMGSTSAIKLDDGNYNTIMGAYAGNSIISETDNVLVGYGAGASTSSDANVMMGFQAGFATTSGEYNTFVGHHAGFDNTTGHSNTFIGSPSGVNITTGQDNIFIGDHTTSLTPGIQCAVALGNASKVDNNYGIAIGYNAYAVVSHTMVLGDNDTKVGIGLSGDVVGPLAKFHVYRKYFHNTSNPTAMYVVSEDVDVNSSYSTGIKNITRGNNEFNTGILSDVYNGDNNTAGAFYATHTANEYNIGVLGEAKYGAVNIGVLGSATIWANPSYFNVGVYGEAPVNPTKPTTPGLGTWAGYFNGDVTAISYNFIPSDSTIKTNIVKFEGASSILNQISCYSYHYDSTKFGNHVNLPKNIQYGFLAQEVEAAFPEVVKYGSLPPKIDSLGKMVVQPQPVMMIDYTRMIPLLQAGYREQETIIDSLTVRLANLEAIVQSCCAANGSGNRSYGNNGNGNRSNGNGTGNIGERESINVKLQEIENSILYQNEPNPYTNTTNIRYFITDNVSEAKITFQDNTGKTFKEVKLTETGQGSLQVDGIDLKNGIYTYSLVISGKIIDTKKMVKTK